VIDTFLRTRPTVRKTDESEVVETHTFHGKDDQRDDTPDEKDDEEAPFVTRTSGSSLATSPSMTLLAKASTPRP
jgi:hypothetical protein